jgi:hypothetical protein
MLEQKRARSQDFLREGFGKMEKLLAETTHHNWKSRICLSTMEIKSIYVSHKIYCLKLTQNSLF